MRLIDADMDDLEIRNRRRSAQRHADQGDRRRRRRMQRRGRAWCRKAWKAWSSMP